MCYQLKYYGTEMRRERHFVRESCQNFERWLDQQLDWFSAGLECLLPGLSDDFNRRCVPLIEQVLGTLRKLRADIRRRFLAAEAKAEIKEVFRVSGPRSIKNFLGRLAKSQKKLKQKCDQLNRHNRG